MSFDVFDVFATDENLENNGTNFPLGKDSSLLIARVGNKRYARALTKAVEARRLEMDVNENSSEEAQDSAQKVSDEVMIEVMADTILLGWTNLTYKKQPMEYSRENAVTLLKVKEFRKKVMTLADSIDAYKVKEEVEAGKT